MYNTLTHCCQVPIRRTVSLTRRTVHTHLDNPHLVHIQLSPTAKANLRIAQLYMDYLVDKYNLKLLHTDIRVVHALDMLCKGAIAETRSFAPKTIPPHLLPSGWPCSDLYAVVEAVVIPIYRLNTLTLEQLLEAIGHEVAHVYQYNKYKYKYAICNKTGDHGIAFWYAAKEIGVKACAYMSL